MPFEKDDRDRLTIVETEIKHIREVIDDFVTRPEFDPVKKLVYGVVALLLSSILVAIVAQVIRG